MKTKLVMLTATVFTAVITSVPVRAAHNDDQRIVSATKQSYVYRTYLKDDDIKIQSKDGAVTLSGAVSDRSHKSMAEDTVENLPGVKSVDNRLEVKTKPKNEKSDDWIAVKVKSA